MEKEHRIRVRWSDWDYYSPIRLRITDWNNLKIYLRNYMLVDSEMEYKGKEIELCVPYYRFVSKLRGLRVESQKAIIKGKAILTLMKTYKWDNQGMVISGVEIVGNKEHVGNYSKGKWKD